MNDFTTKIKEVLTAVLPIALLVLILSFTLVPIDAEAVGRFVIGTVLIIVGLGIFLLGADLGITPMGKLMGQSIVKSNKMYIVTTLGFLLGFLITIAEPDLQILAGQVDRFSGGLVSNMTILIVVSIGVGIMTSIGLVRIIKGTRLSFLFIGVYFIIFMLGLFTSEEFLAVSVDASGATTGAMTTPFILAISYGVSQLKGGKTSEEDSFGMVGLASAGPIFAIMIMSIVKRLTNIQGAPEDIIESSGFFAPYVQAFPQFLKEGLITVAPLIILFLIFDRVSFKLNRQSKRSILFGMFYTFVGLVLFLVGVNAGFMDIGRLMGKGIAENYLWLLPIIGLLLGMVVVLAEPAVHVLTTQVEAVTSGHIKKKAILFTLSAGIALAVCLSMLRIMIPELKLWHFLLPGFGLAGILSYFSPPIFVGIAYDSGGVASGPMTATFVLAFAQGAAGQIPTANVLIDGFGVIAMVAMMPLVALQILGLIFKHKEKRMERRVSSDE